MENDENENDAPHIYPLGTTYLPRIDKFYIRNDSIIHIAAGDRHTIVVTESGRAFAFGDNKSGRTKKTNLYLFEFLFPIFRSVGPWSYE
jgi:alpha-tubulin suppressor-like RCC1 family protein